MKARAFKSNPLNPIRSEHDNLKVAGVTFLISRHPSVRLRIRNPLYRHFLTGAPASKGDTGIIVRLQLGSLPPLERQKKLFDTGESWSLFHDEKYHWISYHPLCYQKPFWVARFDHKVKRVVIFYGPQGQPEAKKTKELGHPICYPLDQLLLMHFLAPRKGILTHAAGVVRNGKAFIFAGASGAGKSTFSQLLAEARVGKLLSDERVIVREIDGVMQAFGTPWAGTAGIARNGNAPLAGIYFLKHGLSNHLKKLAAGDASDKFLPLVSIPWYDPDTMSQIIAFAKHLVAKVPVYEMSFTPDRSAVDFFWQFQKKPS
jgi:hypothetical protein